MIDFIDTCVDMAPDILNTLVNMLPVFGAGFLSGWFLREVFDQVDTVRHNRARHDRRRG